jgi:hypothetical protein
MKLDAFTVSKSSTVSQVNPFIELAAITCVGLLSTELRCEEER